MNLHRRRFQSSVLLLAALLLSGCASLGSGGGEADLVIRNGRVVDGRGGAPYPGGVAVRGERVVALGDVTGYQGRQELDAQGRAIAPGFINMLSQATESLIQDGRSLSDLKQGVTLEVMGEGGSAGPLNETMRAEWTSQQADFHYPVDWTTLGGYLDSLVRRGVATNVASFVGAATVRMHELAYARRDPTPEELTRMQALVAQAMDEGALGVSTALIYTPGQYAKTPEVLALAKTAAASGGAYISHVRSEGDRLLEGIDELIGIARETGTHAEVFHLKAAGQVNWPKMRQAITRIEAARAEGLSVSANMYAYTAGATGLDAAMPPWVQEGGIDAWVDRLRQPETRKKVAAEMKAPGAGWENLYFEAGSPDKVLLIGFANPALKPLTGKSLAEVSRLRGTSPEETAMDLVVEDHTRISTAYFLMSEDNVRLGLGQPWVSLGSDEASQAPEGPFLLSNPHPRAYGNFARFLGHYVRDEQLVPLGEAVRRLTRLPAENLKLRQRGCLDVGCHADIVVFDPATIIDHATFDRPQVYASGVGEVFVNGVQVLSQGEPTGATPGQVVRGPGWRGWKTQ